MRNKKGFVIAGLTGFAAVGTAIAIVGSAVTIGTATVGAVQTYKDGTMKRNGQTIWCKMLNKGNNYCDATYQK